MPEPKCDLAFILCAVRFEDRRVRVNVRDAATFADVGGRPVSVLVLVNPGEFDFELLLSERPDFEFVLSASPRAVDFRCCHVGLRRCSQDQDKTESAGGVFRIRDDEPATRIGARLHRTP